MRMNDVRWTQGVDIGERGLTTTNALCCWLAALLISTPNVCVLTNHKKLALKCCVYIFDIGSSLHDEFAHRLCFCCSSASMYVNKRANKQTPKMGEA